MRINKLQVHDSLYYSMWRESIMYSNNIFIKSDKRYTIYIDGNNNYEIVNGEIEISEKFIEGRVKKILMMEENLIDKRDWTYYMENSTIILLFKKGIGIYKNAEFVGWWEVIDINSWVVKGVLE